MILDKSILARFKPKSLKSLGKFLLRATWIEKGSMTEMRIPVKIKYADDFVRIYATGAIGGFNGFDFRIAFFNDVVNHPEEPTQPPSVSREIKVEVILTPVALKQLTKWLNQHLAELEKMIGEIKDQYPPQPNQRREPHSGYYV